MSKKILILISGFPGTGKTYLSNILINKIKNLNYISPDDLKEEIYDKYGFNNNDEKEKLILQMWEQYFELMEINMKNKKNIISDYPFSIKQYSKIKKLSEKYNYNVLTVRLLADINILFERQRKRDMSLNRHLGHLTTSYHKGQKQDQRTEENGLLLTYEEFSKRCSERGYDKFVIGKLFEHDVTTYNDTEYDKFIVKIINYIENFN